jgi:hypothetical protein
MSTSGVDGLPPALDANLGCSFEELILPGRYLVGMNVKLLGQLRQRAIVLDRCQRHLRLERRRVIPTGSRAHGRS